MVDLDAGLFAKLDMIYDWKSPQFGLDDMRNIVNNFTSCWKLMFFSAIVGDGQKTFFFLSGGHALLLGCSSLVCRVDRVGEKLEGRRNHPASIKFKRHVSQTLPVGDMLAATRGKISFGQLHTDIYNDVRCFRCLWSGRRP